MTDTNATASSRDALTQNGHGEHDDAAAEIAMPPLDAGIEEERSYVAALYRRLDQLREETRAQLAKVRSTGAVGTMQNISERDAFATMHEDRLAQLNAVDDRLVFGRLDLDTDEARYIGRIALTSEDRQRLMLDWRAPEAGAFYQATAFDRHGVRRRRHLLLKRRSVQGIEDEVLEIGRAHV